MADIKRLNYFNSQFLVDKDFNDEQAYHLGMRRRHNRTLHSWGVTDGGLLVAKTGDKEVSIGAGMANDKDGREIVLLDHQLHDLSTFTPNADVYVTVQYQDVQDAADHYTSGGVDNYTRWTERPLVQTATAVPPTDGSVIPLAKVHLNASGNIANIDQSIRPIASSQIDPGSSLQVGSLTVSGNASVGGSFGIGTARPLANLDIRGELRTNRLSFSDLNGIPFPDNWIGVANNIDGTTKWLHIGGITDAGARRLALFADRTIISGNLGIGTPHPANKLHLDGNSSSFGLVFTNAANTAGKRGYRIAFDNDRLTFQRADDAGNFAANQVAIAQDTGNVGIGTTAPKATLHVKSALKVGGTETEAACGKAVMGTCYDVGQPMSFPTSFVGFNAERTPDSKWLLNSDGAHNGAAIIFGDIVGDLSLSTIISQEPAAGGTGNRTISNETIQSNVRVCITGSGNVGIGTTTPGYKLEVNGNVHTTGYSMVQSTKTDVVTASGSGDLTAFLGHYEVGSSIKIEVQAQGGWAELGAEYIINGAWNALPSVSVLADTGIGSRLTFYAKGEADAQGHYGYVWLAATWQNASPNKSSFNIIRFRVTSSADFDTANTTPFTGYTQLISYGLVNINGNVGIGTGTPHGALHLCVTNDHPFVIEGATYYGILDQLPPGLLVFQSAGPGGIHLILKDASGKKYQASIPMTAIS